MKTGLILLSLFIGAYANCQYDNLNIRIGDYTFVTKFDTANFQTRLKIKKDSKVFFNKVSDFPIMGIKQYDLDNDGRKEILIEMYSGGAHCCFYLVAGRLSAKSFTILDTIYWGNSFYEIEDLNKDGKQEIVGSNDMFAYAFTNYAETRFTPLIYEFKNDKFVNVTKNYPGAIKENLDELKADLYSITDTGFRCEDNGEDTFNTEAGTVKTILGPIVDDYYNLGDVQKGYELIDSVYKCDDKDKFIQILQNDYKLK